MKVKADPYLKELTCLYVEDDPSVRAPFLMLTQRYFKEVIVAENGKKGLEKFAQSYPSIVISDIRMSVMDGIEMVSRIKEISPDTMVIFITAFSDVEYLKQAIELGVDGYITKPVDKQKLLLKLNKFAKFLKHKDEIREYTELLKDILDKQNNPTILVENGNKIRYRNKAFEQTFKSVEDMDQFKKILSINMAYEIQKVELEHGKLQLTYEVSIRRLGEKFSFITFQDITEYEEEIMLDQLTNVYNRKILSRLLPKLYKQTNCVILVDIDNFKNVNDTYGHLRGDEVLKVVVDVLKKFLRKDDIIVRFGGEEFLVILSGIETKRVVKRIAEELRRHIEAVEIKQVGHITCSFGVCCQWIENEDDFIELINHTDSALYEAKNNGKNRVEYCNV